MQPKIDLIYVWPVTSINRHCTWSAAAESQLVLPYYADCVRGKGPCRYYILHTLNSFYTEYSVLQTE